jgi:hypothetical protein
MEKLDIFSLVHYISSFLLNGDLGKRILHCRGVKGGGALSPMLFLVAKEPLHKFVSVYDNKFVQGGREIEIMSKKDVRVLDRFKPHEE